MKTLSKTQKLCLVLAAASMGFIVVASVITYLLGVDEVIVEVDTPWAAPDYQAVELKRTKRIGSDINTGVIHPIIAWIDAQGIEHHKRSAFDSSEKYLQSSGALSDYWSEAYGKFMAPFNFTIVSIVPTVVLMEPTEDPVYLSSVEPYIATSDVMNIIQYGTTLSTAENLQWFSPDMKQGPSPVTFSPQGVAEIPLPNGKLVLTRRGNACKITRE